MTGRRNQWALGVLAVSVLLTSAALAETDQGRGEVAFPLINLKNSAVGQVTLTETFSGVMVKLHATGLTPGWHALHLHAVGKCDPADSFKSAGGHFNPEGHQHGALNPQGKHAGDLPNVFVADNGSLDTEALATGVTLSAGPGSLHDADGSALMLHELADDYKTDPAGAAGGRVVCGVVP